MELSGRIPHAPSLLISNIWYTLLLIPMAMGIIIRGSCMPQPTKGYMVGYTQTFKDENGQQGTYKITEAILGFDATRDGQVFVSDYYDSESKKMLKPISFKSPEVTTPIR